MLAIRLSYGLDSNCSESWILIPANPDQIFEMKKGKEIWQKFELWVQNDLSSQQFLSNESVVIFRLIW